MKGKDKTKKQPIGELEALRLRVGNLEKLEEERQRAEEALWRSEERYHSLTDDVLDSSGVGIIILDPDFRIVWVNQALERYFSLRRNEVIGKDKRELIQQRIKYIFEEPESFANKVLTAYDDNTYIKNFECHALPDNGRKERWLEYWSLPIRSGLYAGGRIEHCYDITMRKRAEEALRESEERYRDLFENANDLIQSVTPDGHFLYVNKTWRKMLGYSKEEVANLTVWDIIHPDFIPYCKEVFQKLMSGGAINNVETVFVTKDGKLITVEGNINCRSNGEEVVATRGIFRDITGRKRAEETIKLAYAELDRIFNTTADAMRVVDKDFNVLRVNDTYAALTGISKDEAVGKKCYEVFRDSRCHTPRCTLTRILSGEKRVECAVEKERNDGTRIPCIMTATPLRGPGSKLIGIVENFKDITELRKAQEQLQHSQLLASLGEMTAGIAHEVNNPLGSILLYSELLMANNVPSQTKKDLKIIHDEAKRATRIMTDLLTYSRRVKSQMHRLNLHSILKKALAMRRYEQRVRNISVSTNLLKGPLYVKGDSSQLTQVFLNLMLNAEEVLSERNGGNIVITTQVKGEWAKVSIADDGTGIAEENLNQVFYPFFTTKPIGEGTGLGLSTCYGIVTGHNGLIRAENNEMGGATFITELPLAKTRKKGSLPRKRKRAGLVIT